MNQRSVRSSRHRHDRLLHKEGGAVAIIVALSLVALVGFVGLALDLGKLFVAKTELQNSADACALAAARELTGANTNQLVLAEAAGKTTGERHNVLFQGEQIKIGSSSVTFSETLTGSYQSAFTGPGATNMRFVRCEVNQTGIANWLIQVLNILPGATIGDQTVAASAVASLVPGQTACSIPVAVCESNLSGKSPGEWLKALLKDNDLTGDFLWVRFLGKGAKDLKDILTGPGECNVQAEDEKIDSEPGGTVGAYQAWNTRFGLYQGSYKTSDAAPDLTGFAYTAKSWKECKNAFEGGHFAQQRANNTPFQDQKNKSDNTGLKFPVDPSNTATHNKGSDRRLVSVPIVDCNELGGGSHQTTIKSWACVLMLHPLDANAKPTDEAFACPGNTNSNMFLEYLGPANDPESPCASVGIAGGPSSIGPLVPALVR